jgi:hypothetical protein
LVVDANAHSLPLVGVLRRFTLFVVVEGLFLVTVAAVAEINDKFKGDPA